jgi:hypothetical protein
MAATLASHLQAPKAFDCLLQQSKEKLAQCILFQRNIIHNLRSMQTDTEELDALRAEVDHSHAQIQWLEEQLVFRFLFTATIV